MTSSWTKEFKIICQRLLFRVVEVVSSVLFWVVYHGSGEKMPPIENLLLLDTATAIAHKIRTRKVTSVEVVKTFIARIKEVNPILNCVVDERFSEALEDARKVDEFIQSGVKSVQDIEKDTPFLGVPFSTKDCLQVTGLSHTAGLHCRRNVKAPQDADTIALMREAGAIPFAITNVSEVCMWWESNNTVYGRSNNPYNTNHIVGGSSGGEGCLLAAAGSPLGIGSDIGGSIRMPCFFNGIFGHKPSKGIVSNRGQHPCPSEEQESFLGVGPMCRFAADLLPTLRIIAGTNVDRLQLDAKVDIHKIQLFYMEDDGGSAVVSAVHPEIRVALRKAVFYFDKAYGIKAQKVQIKKMKNSAAIWFAKMKTRDGPAFSEHLLDCKGSVNVYWELLKWLIGMSNHTFIGITTALIEKWGIEHGSEHHRYLIGQCSQLYEELQEMLGNDGVLLYPTHPIPAPYHNEPLVKPFNFSYTGIFNVLGLPATHCPLGLSSQGLPIGIQAVASLNHDHLTLAVALELEKAFGGWVPPSIIV
ncbi:fatty-acid amide hydrolase 2-A [Cryptotermes secundus]|uniref:fatty-acid amide hydrolase 2-A n=1 Tax=Cryptotermes secundus TaxID=105785 RepID=UPI000CD7C2A6|nr:fatty-acid amide hydrolase 2-A [Cryptotermes secundus]